MTINAEMIERAAQIYNTLDKHTHWPGVALHAALRKADLNWDDGLSFDDAVNVLIAVERRARELCLQEGE